MLLKKDIQMIMAIGVESSGGSRKMMPTCLLALVACTTLWFLLAIVASQSNANTGEGVHPVTSSEISLRRSIENDNKELRRLKLAFMKHASKTYLKELKLDPIIGIQAARESGSIESVGLILIAEEFLTIIMKQYIIHRRMLAGLRVFFTRLLPLRTLERLVSKFKSFGWLKGRSKVDLTPAFPNASENQLIHLYSIIDRRARLRAADDVQTLTIENMSRIYKTIQNVLPATPQPGRSDLKAFANHSRRLLEYYLNKVAAYKTNAQIAFRDQMILSKRLVASYGTEKEFLGFIDRTIDTEVLDIDLNKEATKLDLPPTINEAMISNIEKKWLPSNVLAAVNEDRAFLLQHRNMQIIKDWVWVTSYDKAQLARYCERALSDINITACLSD